MTFSNWQVNRVADVGSIAADIADLIRVLESSSVMVDRLLMPVAEGVWIDTEPVRIVGMQLTSTMTVLGLLDGSLLLHSPIRLTAERRAAVEELGPVSHLYAPNTYHHLWMGEWAATFPEARVHAPPGLVRKRPDLRVDRVHGAAQEPAFAGVIDEIPIDGFRLEETALVHRPGQTGVVADLVHNVGRPEGAWTKLYTKTMGFYDRVALSRFIRWAAFFDRPAARRSIDRLLAHPFDSLAVGHGAPLSEHAHKALAEAFAWLPAP